MRTFKEKSGGAQGRRPTLYPPGYDKAEWDARFKAASEGKTEAQPITMDQLLGAVFGAPVGFLLRFFGQEPWNLVAIDNKINPKFLACKHFLNSPEREQEAHDWITEHNSEGRDIYFDINPLKKPLDRKASKEDVACAAWLWADRDPPSTIEDGDLEALDEWRKSIDLDALPPGVPGRPTVTIDSGRGFWHFWKLATPHPVDGKDGTLTAQIEAFGRGLEQAYGSDNIRNIDRIARLPGTINHKTGRRARIIEFRLERTYDVVGFSKPHAEQPHDEYEAPPHRDFDIDKLSPRLRNLITEGRYQDYKTPSEAIFAACAELVREGISDEDIIAFLLNREYKISKHVFEHKDPERQAIIWVARARKKAAKSRPQPNDGRREIQWGPTVIDPAFYGAEQALIQSGGTYQRLGKIVDVGIAKGETADKKDVSYLTIIPRGNYALMKDLARAAQFIKFDPVL